MSGNQWEVTGCYKWGMQNVDKLNSTKKETTSEQIVEDKWISSHHAAYWHMYCDNTVLVPLAEMEGLFQLQLTFSLSWRSFCPNLSSVQALQNLVHILSTLALGHSLMKSAAKHLVDLWLCSNSNFYALHKMSHLVSHCEGPSRGGGG